MYQYKAKLVRVIDGDTIIVDIDLGFNVWVKNRVRLFGIDAWETRTRDLEEKAKGLLAKERLIELLASVDNTFVLVSKGLDKFGRSLAVIYINIQENQIDVNELLITEGHAVTYKP